MYAVTLLRNSTRERLEVLCLVSNKDAFYSVIDDFIAMYGADWLGSHDIDFGFEKC